MKIAFLNNLKLGRMQKWVKTAGFILILAVILTGTIFLGKNASTYIAKASNCDTKEVKSVQVGANSAVVSWNTDTSSRGKVEYGTDPSNMSFSKIEDAEGKSHNVSLTLLTPNTTYYYLLNINNNRCDSVGQKACGTNCTPWNLTTAGVTPQAEVEKVMPIVPTSPVNLVPAEASTSAEPTKTASPTASLSVSPIASPSGTLSTFCTQVQANIGMTDKDSKWSTVKQYDLDANLIINSKDVVKCQKDGK